MATFALTDAFVTVNAVNLSDHVRSVTVNGTADQLDDTAMGDLFRSRIAGLKDWTISLEFNQDFAASNVDATLWAAYVAGTVPVVVRATSAAASATNPQYSGTVVVSAYSPLTNGVGDLATTSVTWQGAGTLARATA